MKKLTYIKPFKIYYTLQQYILFFYIILILPNVLCVLIFLLLMTDIKRTSTITDLIPYLQIAVPVMVIFGGHLIISVLSQNATKNLAESNRVSIYQKIALIIYPFTLCLVLALFIAAIKLNILF